MSADLELDRRDFMRATAAAGVAGAGIAATGTASAGLVDGIVSAIKGAAVATGYGFATMASPSPVFALADAGGMQESLSTSPTEDETILHNMATAEAQALGAHETMFSNRIADTATVASIEARHQIATAWEDGKSSSTAYQEALERIRQYYSVPEWNHYHVTAKSLLQLSHIAGTAADMGDPQFIGCAAFNSDDSNSYQLRMTGERTEVEIALHDGTQISNVDDSEIDDVSRSDGSTALKVPKVTIRDTTNGTDVDTVPLLDQSVVDSWDSSAEEFTLEDSSGTTYTSGFQFTVPNVGEELDTKRVFDGTEFGSLLDDIHSKSDTVTGNYSESFVSDIYAELDAGNITPEQVRSAEGMVRFLSGTDDPSKSRFQISMMQQLDMVQPDMSRVAEVAVEWSGATDSTVELDPNVSERRVYPSDYVTDQGYRGMLFGSDAPSDGFQTGNSYLVGTQFGLIESNNGEVYMSAATDVSDVSISGSTPTSNGDIFEFFPDRKMVVVAQEGSNSVTAYDARTLEQKWDIDAPNTLAGLNVDADGNVLVAHDGGGVVSYAQADGSENWSISSFANDPYCIAATGDPEKVAVGTTGGAALVDAPSQSIDWEYTGASSTVNSIEADADAEHVHIGYNTGPDVKQLDWSDGSVVWTNSDAGDTIIDLAFDSRRGQVLSTETGDSYLRAIDVSDGSANWQTQHQYPPYSIAIEPGGGRYLTGTNSGIHSIDPDDNGTMTNTVNPTNDNSIGDIAFAPAPEPVDGLAGRALVYDEGSDDSDGQGEVDLWDGVLTVTEMVDAEGASITHVSDQTIADIEALDATPDSIDTIVSEMDEFESVDDIQYRTDVEAILDHYNAGDQIGEVTIEDTDYETPKYDTYNSQEFAEYLNTLETYQEQLEAQNDGGSGGAAFSWSGFAQGGGIGLILVAVGGFFGLKALAGRR